MTTRRHVLSFALASTLTAVLVQPALAQETIKIGELNSYKSQPAFLDPYKKGMDLALEEINAKGGVLGKKLELISRDDGANPGEAVRVAEELVTREGVPLIAGTFLSHIGLAVTNFAGQKKVFFLAAEPLTDKITWQNGNRYTFRLRATTYMQTAMLMPAAIAAKKKRWALVYPNFEYGQSAAENFKTMLKKAQPDVEFVTEQAPPLGKVDAGAVAQAIDDAKPDAIFNVLFGADLTQLCARGHHPRRVQEPHGVEPAVGRAGISRSAQGRSAGRLDRHRLSVGQDQDAGAHGVPRRLPEEVQRLSAARLDRRLCHHQVAGRRHREGQGTDTEKMIEAFRGLKVDSPFGPFEYRASDHQATMGAYVGKIALENGKGTMVDFKYVDGKDVLPGVDEVKKLRPAEAN